MSLAIEREHVMLAHRVEIDILHYDHVVVGLMEKCLLEYRLRILAITLCKELHSLSHAERSL